MKLFLDTLSKKVQIPNFMKICPVESELFYADRWTDIQKLIVAFRTSENAPKNWKSTSLVRIPSFYETQQFITIFTTARYYTLLSPLISWKIHYMLNYHLCLRLPSYILSSLPTKTLKKFFLSCKACYMPWHMSSFLTYDINRKTSMLHITSFPPPLVTSSPSDPHASLRAHSQIFSNTCSSPTVRD